MLEIESAKLVLNLVDTETGEIITKETTLGDFKDKKKSSSRTKKLDDNDPVAKLNLLDNKIQLNASAVKLTGYIPDMKIDVKFEKKGRSITPILCPDDKTGNRLTKTYTVSFRGSRHDNLSEYGTVFELLPYEDKEKWFKLKGDAPIKEDDIIDLPEELNDPEQIDLDTSSVDDVDFNLDFDL